MNTDSCTTRTQSDTLASLDAGRMFALEQDGTTIYTRTEQVYDHDVTCCENGAGKLVIFTDGTTVWPVDLAAFSD